MKNKICIYIPDELLLKLRKYCKKEDRPLSNAIRVLLEDNEENKIFNEKKTKIMYCAMCDEEYEVHEESKECPVCQTIMSPCN